MKALSIQQPWAWLICAGYKDIENRGWQTKFRGRVYVHAGKYWDAVDGSELYPKYKIPLMERGLSKTDFLAWWKRENPRTDGVKGEIVGEVDIVDCVRESKSAWFAGPYGFVLRNPTCYKEPIPCRGKLGFFDPDLSKLQGVK